MGSNNQPQLTYGHVDIDIAHRSCPILHLDVRHDGNVYWHILKYSIGDPLSGNIAKWLVFKSPVRSSYLLLMALTETETG